MKKFTQKLNEDLNQELNIDSYIEVFQKELISMVENEAENRGIEKDDTDGKKEIIESYIQDPETIIIGLVNDSDLFDLYVKFGNEIDNILNGLDHFTKSPSDLGVSGSIYEYIVESTRISVIETFKKMLGNEEN